MRSSFELIITAVPFICLCACAWASAHFGWWWGLISVPLAAGFLVRLFMIQHDCGHGAFFGRRLADDWTGRLIGIFTFTPYDCWRRDHAVHHAHTGNLDKRGVGDIMTLTVSEFQKLGWWGRLGYRLYRHPVVMFGLGPAWIFVLQQRLPADPKKAGLRGWTSAMATNLAILVLSALLIWWIGPLSFSLVYLSIMLLAGAAGIWLFYVQHQFPDAHWTRTGDWDFQTAALQGSSYYDLPHVLRWFTANIGLHHIHHLASRIPFYRLSQVLRDYPALADVGRISVPDSLRSVKLVLWDEEQNRLVSFRQARGKPSK